MSKNTDVYDIIEEYAGKIEEVKESGGKSVLEGSSPLELRSDVATSTDPKQTPTTPKRKPKNTITIPKRLFKMISMNYLKGYKTAYEKYKNDPLSKVKMDYEEVKEALEGKP